MSTEPSTAEKILTHFGTSLAIFSAISSFILFLAISTNSKLRNSYRFQFLVMLICDAILALFFLFYNILFIGWYFSEQLNDFQNFFMRLYPIFMVVFQVCEAVSDYIILSVAVEIIVLLRASSQKARMARWLGIGLSILLGTIAQIPYFNSYETADIDGKVRVYTSDWVTQNLQLYYILVNIVVPVLTSAVPFLVLLCLVAVIGRQLKTTNKLPESKTSAGFSSIFKLLSALLLLRFLPDIFQKVTWSLFTFYVSTMYKQGFSYESFMVVFTLSEVLVELTRGLSFFAFLCWDKQMRVGFCHLKLVRVFVDFVDFISFRLFSRHVAWKIASYGDYEGAIRLVAAADDIEMDDVESQTVSH